MALHFVLIVIKLQITLILLRLELQLQIGVCKTFFITNLVINATLSVICTDGVNISSSNARCPEIMGVYLCILFLVFTFHHFTSRQFLVTKSYGQVFLF